MVDLSWMLANSTRGAETFANRGSLQTNRNCPCWNDVHLAPSSEPIRLSGSLKFLNVSDRLLALFEGQCMNARRRDLQTKRCNEPFHGLSAGLEGIDAVAPHLCRDQRFERIVELALALAQRRVGQPTQRRVVLAASPYANPCLAQNANPDRAMIFEVGVGVFTRLGKRRLGAAVIANRLGKRRNRAANAHWRDLRSTS
ncbi:protein of unknown function (plasmid) [Cupriavidus taiwanensis]|uniref:Uncharacterized protein n=1 Tax=Cupriavidus taiwanensis TaxID=164546 RepID=A0A375I9Y6_9BURK|nr:hypothetical protein CT19425_U230014 [Cupriavidus taiwanensis]SPK70162.1 hypothetical protein CT19425_U380016 [Cupriavidus taiwanensis]SPK77706.1 protein of unknown function [Cupriavidus taiwanensis]